MCVCVWGGGGGGGGGGGADDNYLPPPPPQVSLLHEVYVIGGHTESYNWRNT